MNVISKDLGYGIKSITLNDPKTYNSLSFKTLNELSRLLKKLDADSKTRVIIISGNGKGFSAGHNLKEVKNFAKSSISRRKYLLSYFGEKYDSTIYNDQEMDDNSKNPQNPIIFSTNEFNKFVLETFIFLLLQLI